MGTYQKYIICKKCKTLGPSPVYFYAKNYLSKKAKTLCLNCLEKIKKYKINKPIEYKLCTKKKKTTQLY